MKPIARILVVASLLTVATAALSPAASAKAKEVELLTGDTAAVMAGANAWVALNWTSSENISDFRVVLDSAPDGVTVSYPDNLASWTGLAGGHFLDADEVDFTALKLSIPASYSKKDAKVSLSISYDFEGQAQSGNFSFKVPVVQFSGDVDLSQTTDAAEVSAGDGWVNVSFAGYAPSSNGFNMVVSNPGDLAVIYPGYGSSTSLHGDTSLKAGENDVARFFVDASDTDAGQYPVSIEVTYDAGQGTQTLRGNITVSVTE